MSAGGRQPLPGYELVGRGPAQRRLVEWAGERVPGCELGVAVAQRSPAGPWALKLRAPAGRAPEVAALLEAEAWVERVVARPQHLYVRIGCERLCEWVAEGFAPGAPDPLAGDEGRGRSVLVRAADAGALSAAGEERPLRLVRETAVARSVAALLGARGFDVQLELLAPAGAGRETYDELWADAPGSVTHTLVVGAGVPLPTDLERGDHVVHLPVGEVDVRHGPLRARNGGSVSADDVVAEAGAEHGEAVLALLLLATPRTRRIQLDEAALARETETFGCLTRVLEATGLTAAEADARPRGELLRDLAAVLDLTATNAGRAATALDPALVARSLRSVAERAERLGGAGAEPAPGRLWDAARRAAQAAFALGGIVPGAARHGTRARRGACDAQRAAPVSAR